MVNLTYFEYYIGEFCAEDSNTYLCGLIDAYCRQEFLRLFATSGKEVDFLENSSKEIFGSQNTTNLVNLLHRPEFQKAVGATVGGRSRCEMNTVVKMLLI